MPLSPLCVFLGLYAVILRQARSSVRKPRIMAPARTPRAAKRDKAQWSATQKSSATHEAGFPHAAVWASGLQPLPHVTEGGPVSTSPHAAQPIKAGPIPKHRYPRFPAVDALLDLLRKYGVPAANIHTHNRHGKIVLTVQLPHGTYTDEYIGSDIQLAARAWLNGEADEFSELLKLDRDAAAAKQAA